MLRLIPVALTALMLTAFPAAAQKLSLNQISQYLNSIQSAKSPFTQINGDGSKDIADVVFLYNFLFQGSQRPICLDSSDANDDGFVDEAEAKGIREWAQ